MKTQNQHATVELDSKELSAEEQNEIAGLAYKPIEVAKEEKLDLENDTPSKLATEDKAMPRTIFMAAVVGIFILFGVGLWQVLQPRYPEPAVVSEPETQVSEEEVSEADYRGKLALRDQKIELSTPQPSEEKPVPKPVVPATPPLRSAPVVRYAPPPPRPVSRPIQRSYSPRTQTKPEQKVDPFERWEQLASLGKVQTSELPKPSVSNLRTRQRTLEIANRETDEPIPVTRQTRKIKSESLQIPTVRVSLNKTEANNDNSRTPGIEGILNRRRSDRETSNSSAYEIAFGTTVRGVVSTPLLWDESEDSDNQAYKRFSISLSENLTDANGRVALPSGTVIIAQADRVNPKNRLVRASAIAIVYKDLRGRTRQQAIEPNTILVEAQSNQPLIAKGYFDDGGTIARSDLLVSTLSGIGKVGKVLTEPKTTSTVSSGLFGGFSSSTTQSRDPELWAAVLDGFFSPLSERLSARSEKQIEELAKRPNVAIVAPNTKVSLLVNGFITISR
ncbi:hypothetical protein [Chroococcidiopsis sp.]|uniref:hypothetical protein n=1 Tax=Chroococcidiopsis sp. TaxID=3088168 RepID=UPI003F3D2BE7